MARRRKEQSLPELAFGICMFVIAITIFNPKLREQIFSTVATIIAFIVVIGIFGAVIYLLIQAKKIKNAPDYQPVRSRPGNCPTFTPATTGVLTDEDREHFREFYKSNQPLPEPAPRAWDVSVLRKIEWKRFETVCTEYLKIAGFVAKETNTGADGGVDIQVTKADDENFRGIVQCKAWNAYKVGIKPIRELFGVMAAERITAGIFITSGEFTSEAEEFAKGKITLVWGERFINLIKKLSEDEQKRLLDIALEGDYRTPTCPQCGIKMTLRESKSGRNAGGQFWGCIRYPRCRQTLIYKEI